MIKEARVGTIVVGGQPDAADLRRFGTVVNVRLPDEEGNTTARDVAGTGIAYHEVPLTADTLTAGHIERVKAALAGASGDVLIH